MMKHLSSIWVNNENKRLKNDLLNKSVGLSIEVGRRKVARAINQVLKKVR
jgi:hypothetical protein